MNSCPTRTATGTATVSANVGDEYIEIINLDSIAINVKNWKLDTGVDSKAFTLPDITLQPRQIAFFFQLSDRHFPERWRRHGAPAETEWVYCGCLYLSGSGTGRPDLVPPFRMGRDSGDLSAAPARAGPIFSPMPARRAHPRALIHLPAE